jgi:hypothetical protein
VIGDWMMDHFLQLAKVPDFPTNSFFCGEGSGEIERSEFQWPGSEECGPDSAGIAAKEMAKGICISLLNGNTGTGR